MATKTKKTAAKKSAAKMRDLPARKNPQGGAQKKEFGNPGTDQATRRGATNRGTRQLN